MELESAEEEGDTITVAAGVDMDEGDADGDTLLALPSMPVDADATATATDEELGATPAADVVVIDEDAGAAGVDRVVGVGVAEGVGVSETTAAAELELDTPASGEGSAEGVGVSVAEELTTTPALELADKSTELDVMLGAAELAAVAIEVVFCDESGAMLEAAAIEVELETVALEKGAVGVADKSTELDVLLGIAELNTAVAFEVVFVGKSTGVLLAAGTEAELEIVALGKGALDEAFQDGSTKELGGVGVAEAEVTIGIELNVVAFEVVFCDKSKDALEVAATGAELEAVAFENGALEEAFQDAPPKELLGGVGVIVAEFESSVVEVAIESELEVVAFKKGALEAAAVLEEESSPASEEATDEAAAESAALGEDVVIETVLESVEVAAESVEESVEDDEDFGSEVTSSPQLPNPSWQPRWQ